MNQPAPAIPAPLLALLRGERVAACDPDEIWKLAGIHGIEPVIADALLHRVDQPLPVHLRAEIDRTRNFAFVRNLQLLALLNEIKRAFEKEGIVWIALKGPVFTQQYTGGLSLRVSGDLDVLVRPGDVLKADAALQGIGIQPRHPVQRKLHPRLGRARKHEHEYYSSSPRHLVELHWHLTASCYELVDDDAAFARAHHVTCTDGSFPVLSPEDTLLHYTLHAFGHRWDRLYHVKTLDWILKQPLDWPYMLAAAAKADKTRPLLLGLLLAHELLHAALPEEALRMIPSDPVLLSLKQQVYGNFQRRRHNAVRAFLFKWRGLESAHDRLHLIWRAVEQLRGGTA